MLYRDKKIKMKSQNKNFNKPKPIKQTKQQLIFLNRK